MALVTSTEMFKKAYDGGYAIGAFNVNNMEIVQGITEAAAELKSPLILQASAGARKYANSIYLVKLVEAAVELHPEIPIVLHLDHGADFATCKDCIDGGFTSVMIDYSSHSFEENIAETKKVVEYHTALLLRLSSDPWQASRMMSRSAQRIPPTPVRKRSKSSFPAPDATPSLSLSEPATAHTSSNPAQIRSSAWTSLMKFPRDSRASRSFCTDLPPFRRNMSRSSTRTAAL